MLRPSFTPTSNDFDEKLVTITAKWRCECAEQVLSTLTDFEPGVQLQRREDRQKSQTAGVGEFLSYARGANSSAEGYFRLTSTRHDQPQFAHY